MFPEVLIGPVVIVCGALIVLYRRRLTSVMRRASEVIYGEATADIWFSGRRGVTGVLVAGIGWILVGALTLVSAFISL